jgi:hypothetical protein
MKTTEDLFGEIDKELSKMGSDLRINNETRREMELEDEICRLKVALKIALSTVDEKGLKLLPAIKAALEPTPLPGQRPHDSNPNVA